MNIVNIRHYKCEHCNFESPDREKVGVHESICRIGRLDMLNTIETDVLQTIGDTYNTAMRWWPIELTIAEHLKDKYSALEVDKAIQALERGNLIAGGWRDQGGWCYVYRVIKI